MAQLLAAIKFVATMWPLIEQSIHMLQAMFPTAGVAKLDALLKIIDAAVAEQADLTDLYAQAKPKLTIILNPLIALVKKTAPTQ